MNELNPNLNKANKEVTMELNFIKSGDYYIPDIKLKNPNIRLGKWGRMRREYLRQAHPIVFSEMVLRQKHSMSIVRRLKPPQRSEWM